MQGKATWLQLLKNWFFSFFGNLAGSLFIVWLVDETFLFQTGPLSGVANAKAVAVSKTSAASGTTVVRGLLCNWLVSSYPFLIPPHSFIKAFPLIWGMYCPWAILPVSGASNAKAVAVAKTSAPLITIVVRGLLCNWLVSH